MDSNVVAAETFHVEMSPLKATACANICLKVSTLDVSHLWFRRGV